MSAGQGMKARVYFDTRETCSIVTYPTCHALLDVHDKNIELARKPFVNIS